MYNRFFINKQSGTYSETLEAFGVANLVYEILTRSNISKFQITIEDLGLQYLVQSNKPISEEHVDKLTYFQVLKFIKKDALQELPPGITKPFDYPKNKAIQDGYKAEFIQIEKLKSDEAKKQARKDLNNKKLSEFGENIDSEYDVYREIIKNPYSSFNNLFYNFYSHQNRFPDLIKSILIYYNQQTQVKLNFKLTDEKPTALQLFNPNQGKGLNKNKANNVSMGNLDGHWISETMKISGAFLFMICQYVKVGSGYDMKVYVPEFHEIGLSEAKKMILDFKKYLKSTSPIKLDILNSLDFTINFIKNTPEYKGKVRKTLKGFHSVYQKDLGQNKAVANIAFINTPDFVEYSNKEEGNEWVEIIEQQRNLISNIEEHGDSIQGLQNYRSFTGSIGNSALEYFSEFSYWYAGFLMQKLTSGNRFVRIFKIDHLTKFYRNMDTKETNLMEIIQNDGFKAIASAIRNSTLIPQIFGNEIFKPRYGIAQELQNKSKSKDDLTTFIGEFITLYNVETARKREIANSDTHKINDKRYYRKLVNESELTLFYSILDKTSSSLVGALLASYGFALNKKDAPKDDLDTEETTANED